MALGLGEVIGKFEIGFEFDEHGPWDFFSDDDVATLFEKWVNLGDERNIKRAWVQGKDVTV
jgi:guanine deaminase